MKLEHSDILIIGAGPAGAVAAGLLKKQGHQVLIIEKETFPRFSIGESLLPQSMAYIEEAGMLQDVVEAGFQHKNGAAFARGDLRTAFDFRDKFSCGWGTTYQVQRAHFDKVLADAAQKAGAEIRYRHTVTGVDVAGAQPQVTARTPQGEEYVVQARHLLDASGFARILPRMLGLERPSGFPVRAALFTHVEDRIAAQDMDRDKILISVHPEHRHVWFWTIPFSNGRSSQGVVATPEFLERHAGSEVERLRAIIAETPSLAHVLRNATWDTPGRSITGYAANVTALWGKGFALLAEMEADSLRLQRELVAHTSHVYSLLGPFSIAEDVRTGRLQAARIVNPECRRHVTLALPKQGQLTPACKIVAQLIQETVESWGHQLSEPAPQREAASARRAPTPSAEP